MAPIGAVGAVAPKLRPLPLHLIHNRHDPDDFSCKITTTFWVRQHDGADLQERFLGFVGFQFFPVMELLLIYESFWGIQPCLR